MENVIEKIKFPLKQFLIHLLAALFYLGITSYWFVMGRDPNPIGIGFQQDICMLLHLIIAIVIPIRSKYLKRSRTVNFLIVLAIIILYLLLSNWIWNWLWSLR